MVIVSIPRGKLTRFFIWIVFFLCFLPILLGCNRKSDRYPYDLASKWICNELPFTLYYSLDDNGMLLQSEMLEWNGQSLAVDLAFSLNTYCVYPESSHHHDDRLFSGTWKYRDGNLVLTLTEDFIFDQKYAELTFLPTS